MPRVGVGVVDSNKAPEFFLKNNSSKIANCVILLAFDFRMSSRLLGFV